MSFDANYAFFSGSNLYSILPIAIVKNIGIISPSPWQRAAEHKHELNIEYLFSKDYLCLKYHARFLIPAASVLPHKIINYYNDIFLHHFCTSSQDVINFRIWVDFDYWSSGSGNKLKFLEVRSLNLPIYLRLQIVLCSVIRFSKQYFDESLLWKNEANWYIRF